MCMHVYIHICMYFYTYICVLASSPLPNSNLITHTPANPPLPPPHTLLDINTQILPPTQKPYERKSNPIKHHLRQIKRKQPQSPPYQPKATTKPKAQNLKQVYRKQNSAHLLAHAHEVKVTPFTTTINTAWKLLHDYKGDDSSASPQLPSQMRTNISADKQMWTEGDIQREPHIGIISWLPLSSFSFFLFPLSRLGMNPKQIESHRHSTYPIHPTRKSQTPDSTKPPPGRKLRKY